MAVICGHTGPINTARAEEACLLIDNSELNWVADGGSFEWR